MVLNTGNTKTRQSLRMLQRRHPWLLLGSLAVATAVLAVSVFFPQPLRDGYHLGRDVVLGVKNRWSVEHLLLVENSWFRTQVGVSEGVLVVSGENGRYFADGNGREVYLTGSHTWSNLQDTGAPPAVFDYEQYLGFLESHGHNFFRLWAWEQAKWGSWTSSGIEFSPLPYVRTGPGTALDDKPRFDLSQFNESYFSRLRQRVVEAQNRGIYVSVMLFDGWSVEEKAGGYPNPWQAHPYHGANNINNINGDPNGDGQGSEVHTLSPSVSAITSLQQAYIRKVVDTVNDLDNVLYEISNESSSESTAWQYAMIDYIKGYEATKAKQHPVGMTVAWPNGNNDVLLQSPADWISPNGAGGYLDNPPANDGTKVIVSDTDHLWGIGGNVPWVWKSFTRGLNTLFMDAYDCSPFWPPSGCDTAVWEGLRRNLGYTRAYAERLNLGQALPRGDLCATQYCLVNTSAGDAEYLVYQPNGGASFTVNLAGVSGSLQVEWLNPGTGAQSSGGTVSGGTTVQFTPPFNSADGAVLFLEQQPGAPTPTPTPTATPLPGGPIPSTPTAYMYLPAVGGGNASHAGSGSGGHE